MAMRFWCSICFLSLFLSFITEALSAVAFTGTYGINYGRIADNIPSPDEVVQLLRQSKIKNVRIYDFDHQVLDAFSGTGLELVIGLPNGYLKDMSQNADHALSWVKDNVQNYIPRTRIVGIAVGNEVLGGSDQDLWDSLLGAAKNIHNATKQLNLDHAVQISTAHSYGVFNNSYPPSSCIFAESVKDKYMKPLLQFFSQIGSPFCLNVYPFLTYMSDPDSIDLNYALFEKATGIRDPKTGLHYDNLLDAQIDAVYAALEDAGFKKMEVIVTETGWASKGDPNEAVATPENARTYNYNLRKRLALKKGTPYRPKIVLRAYIFALFNENSKPGPTSERNFGLFKPDGSIAYDIGFQGMKSSAASLSLLSGKISANFTSCLTDYFGVQPLWNYSFNDSFILRRRRSDIRKTWFLWSMGSVQDMKMENFYNDPWRTTRTVVLEGFTPIWALAFRTRFSAGHWTKSTCNLIPFSISG